LVKSVFKQKEKFMPDYLASHLLVDQLAAEGTKYIFGSLSSANSPIISAALEGRSDIQYLPALHEELAGAMAIGYAQASGRPSVLCLPAATGLINGLSSMYLAQRARIPLIVIADEQDTEILNDEQPLGGDLLGLAKPLAKWACELRATSQIARNVRRAFHEALSPPKGPVLISSPVDLLIKLASGQTIPPPQTTPLGAADPNFCKKAAKALVSAKKPCVILGNEVSQFHGRKEAVTLVEVLGCPAYSEPIPTGVNFPNRHPHFAGVLPLEIDKASEMLESYDVFLVLGMQTRLAARSDEPPLFPPTAIVIQLNIEGGLAGRTLPCDLTATADISESLARLRAEIQLVVDTNWVADVKMRTKETVSKISLKRQTLEETIPFPSPTSAIPMIWLLRLLDAVRPSKSIIVSDVVCDYANPYEILSLEGSSSFYATNAGVGGYALAGALGVQWASAGSVVISLTSDESALRSPQALWTASRYALPVKFIIINNLGRANFSMHLVPMVNNPHRVLLDSPTIDIRDIARSMKVPSYTVDTIAALESSLQLMFETPGPCVLDVHIDDSSV
jgi:benzoylformate decarboxylase